MMNYIWAGLIVAALVFAFGNDLRDLLTDRFGNDRTLRVTLEFTTPEAVGGPVKVRIHGDKLHAKFPREPQASGSVTTTGELTGDELALTAPQLPGLLGEMRKFLDDDNKVLRARVIRPVTDISATQLASVDLLFPPVRFVKLKAITNAAFEFAKTAITISLGLIGVLALWMGLMKIAEDSGLIAIFVVLVQPFLRLLFPQVPKGHPALGMIALNLAANMLGLGNAATPMGLKAMEELQKLNPRKETATDSMVMLLALNTAGVQLLPSATLIAVMGLASVRLFIPILLVTGVCAVIAVIAAKLLGRLNVFRKTDPTLDAEVAV